MLMGPAKKPAFGCCFHPVSLGSPLPKKPPHYRDATGNSQGNDRLSFLTIWADENQALSIEKYA
jgi:hypothetical protein